MIITFLANFFSTAVNFVKNKKIIFILIEHESYEMKKIK